MIWLIKPEELEEFDRLDQFCDWVFQFGLENSRGERFIMERAIEKQTGASYHHVDKLFCSCSECWKSVGPEVVWKSVLLTNLALNFQQRNEWRGWVSDQFGEDRNDIVELFDDMYELGYQTARMYGEYQMKEEIEVSALVGLKAQKDQGKRAEAAGKMSREKRSRRIEALLLKMEEIANRNPDIRRPGQRALANLALSDAESDEPALWTQGKGRRDEYLDEMKSDIRYRARFKAIFYQ